MINWFLGNLVDSILTSEVELPFPTQTLGFPKLGATFVEVPRQRLIAILGCLKMTRILETSPLNSKKGREHLSGLSERYMLVGPEYPNRIEVSG